MENGELVILEDATKYNLPPQKASELTGGLVQIIVERGALAQQYNQIIRMDIEDAQTSKAASALRKLIKNNRTQGIEKWHKAEKEYFLRGGQFVDAVKKREIAENVRMEEALEQIENHFVLKEKARIDELEAKRKGELEPYVEFVVSNLDLRSMSDGDFANVLNGAKLLKEDYDKKVAREKAEEEARVLAQNVYNQRLLEIAPYGEHAPSQPTLETTEAEWKKLLKTAKENKASHDAQVEKQRIENEKLKKEAAERDAKRQAEIKAEIEKQNKIKAAADAKLKAEQEARIKVEEELKAKQKAEDDARKAKEAEELAAKQRAEELAKAPIKDQLNEWVGGFSIPGVPVDDAVAFDIAKKFEAFKIWASDQIKKM